MEEKFVATIIALPDGRRYNVELEPEMYVHEVIDGLIREGLLEPESRYRNYSISFICGKALKRNATVEESEVEDGDNLMILWYNRILPAGLLQMMIEEGSASSLGNAKHGPSKEDDAMIKVNIMLPYGQIVNIEMSASMYPYEVICFLFKSDQVSTSLPSYQGQDFCLSKRKPGGDINDYASLNMLLTMEENNVRDGDDLRLSIYARL